MLATQFANRRRKSVLLSELTSASKVGTESVTPKRSEHVALLQRGEYLVAVPRCGQSSGSPRQIARSSPCCPRVDTSKRSPIVLAFGRARFEVICLVCKSNSG